MTKTEAVVVSEKVVAGLTKTAGGSIQAGWWLGQSRVMVGTEQGDGRDRAGWW